MPGAARGCGDPARPAVGEGGLRRLAFAAALVYFTPGARTAFTSPLPDPLLTALSQLLGIFGNARSEDALASGIPHERPLQPASFSRIAEAHGCKVRIQSRRIDQISDLLLPVIPDAAEIRPVTPPLSEVTWT